ncbi:M48 family metalloprotease [Salinarchaeum sp. Harcht-Bsk1]|uniref:M48 family metalloprotease n=1 Tax=Salinarchaeum sp. Harcht-Bsk1 TaxID=1333523 RepID=UPI00067815E1|nr:M48 family metalloprotease [Salinarchaeum sp. Harcht-Bsk1]
MNHRGLQVRMALVGTILFAFYLAIATVAYAAFNIPLAIVLIGSFGLVGIQYVLGKKMALWTTGAKDMPEDGQYAQVHRSVERFSEEMGIEKPRLMVASMGVPNAFATGRRGAGVVVVSEELMSILDHDELEGVLAHELAHIENRDVLTMTIGQSIAMMVGIAVHWIVLFTGERSLANYFLGYLAGIVAQMFVMVFVMAISRYREYIADADAAQVIGTGDPLARALEKISRGAQASGNEVDDSVAALCIFGGAERLLSTHPPTEERISRLRSY